jgi:hypothetical protein
MLARHVASSPRIAPLDAPPFSSRFLCREVVGGWERKRTVAYEIVPLPSGAGPYFQLSKPAANNRVNLTAGSG